MQLKDTALKAIQTDYSLKGTIYFLVKLSIPLIISMYNNPNNVHDRKYYLRIVIKSVYARRPFHIL